MPDTSVERELLPGCSVVAVLEHIGQGMERERFIELSIHDRLITWAFNLNHNASIVGHATSLTPLQNRISAVAARSFSMSSIFHIRRRPLTISGQATGKLRMQTHGPGAFAVITIRVQPCLTSQAIQVAIPRSAEIPDELHSGGLPEAILSGICLATLSQKPAEPLVGFQVTVLGGKWHDVDSSCYAFKQAAYAAMYGDYDAECQLYVIDCAGDFEATCGLRRRGCRVQPTEAASNCKQKSSSA